MSIIKCKMCGGDIEFTPGATYGTCEYCGSTSTIPKADDKNKLNRYNRANHFRRQCEFDKAVAAYEKLLEQDDTDAEAHWGAVLSRYGIEYVEDPATQKRIPTCHRVQMASILADADYKAAVEHAPDAESRRLYEDQAAQIAEIQKGILAVSANEKPYDVFICYKETDEIGQRTHDSQWAQDVYYGLTEQGYKVFFARITLEDKLGQQYEPYIFAALNSAKVMVVIGSKPEYFNAVWVKNEWSRYLALMAKDRTRLLIPCYRGMDPYDLPEELSNLQSQDMSKIGFMQDLIRGISKVLTTEKPQQAAPAAAPASAVAPLLRRAFMFLEDGDWDKADDFCEQVLNLEPENAEAYLGKLMAELKVSKREKLPDQPQPFHKSSNYAKACRFSDTLAAELKGCTEHIIRRNEEARVAGIYDRACQTMRNAHGEEDFEKAIKLFQSIIKHRDSQSMIQQCHEGVMNCRYQAACQQKASASSEAAYKAASQLFANLGQYKDAAAQAAECLELAEASRKDDIYQTASHKMSNTSDQNSWAYAEKLFKSIPGWKNADEKAIECENKIAELKAKEEAYKKEKERQAQLAREKAAKEAKLKKTIAIVASVAAVIVAAVVYVMTTIVIPNQKYDAAVALMEAGEYEQAITAFAEIETHKDSAAQIEACEAAIHERDYQVATTLLNEGKYYEAYVVFDMLSGYRDSNTQCLLILKEHPAFQYREVKVGDYITFGVYEQDANTSNGKEPIEWRVLAKEDNRILVISRYALDCKPFHERKEAATWSNCSLRSWMNYNFVVMAFTTSEQSMIATVTVPKAISFEYKTDSGSATQDKVFLLDISEFKKYAGSTKNVQPTAYAKQQGVRTDSGGYCFWWLRVPGRSHHYADYIDYSGGGSMIEHDASITSTTIGVRPAMWISLEP